jgi:predicted GNAT family acetyltransferase
MSTTHKPNDDVSRLAVINNKALSQFEVHIGEALAVLRYTEELERIWLYHTEVPETLSGRGIAGRLAAFALNDARHRGLRVVPTCPYVRAYIDRHPEYASLVEKMDAGTADSTATA